MRPTHGGGNASTQSAGKSALNGVDEVNVVMRVDREGQAADLLPIVYGQRRLDSIPFVIMDPTQVAQQQIGRQMSSPILS